MEDVSKKDDQEAKKRVRAIRAFQIHLVVYIVVNIILFIVDYLTSPGYWWFYWALIGTSIGLFWHAMAAFVFGRSRSKS